MRKLIAIVLTGAALSAAAAPAFAADRWSDAEYLKANRCLGLAQSADLGAVDATALTAQIKDQGRGRDISMRDRGDSTRDDARRAGKTRNDAVKAKLTAELGGSCQAYLGTSVATSGASS
ncbi:hypothetical protein [Caulobacter sp.]|uniref:hypothetical protein n=1 Tax=Caulobacter sp. TaxID=78 RepID=UPI001B0355B5|nr:hypothetical protein [Caulobacter sp.]MBO9545417.1 hypothetical protein [Caulobacter sp.]